MALALSPAWPVLTGTVVPNELSTSLLGGCPGRCYTRGCDDNVGISSSLHSTCGRLLRRAYVLGEAVCFSPAGRWTMLGLLTL